MAVLGIVPGWVDMYQKTWGQRQASAPSPQGADKQSDAGNQMSLAEAARYGLPFLSAAMILAAVLLAFRKSSLLPQTANTEIERLTQELSRWHDAAIDREARLNVAKEQLQQTKGVEEVLEAERALRREMMEALEPFARWGKGAGESNDWWARSNAPLCLNMQRIAADDDVTVQDLIRAAAVLAKALTRHNSAV